MRVICDERQEVIPVARHQHRLAGMSKTKNGGIVRLGRQHLPETCNGVAPLCGDAPNSIRNVLVEQECHVPASAIWRAIK
jgi:hypothetical protein